MEERRVLKLVVVKILGEAQHSHPVNQGGKIINLKATDLRRGHRIELLIANHVLGFITRNLYFFNGFRFIYFLLYFELVD